METRVDDFDIYESDGVRAIRIELRFASEDSVDKAIEFLQKVRKDMDTQAIFTDLEIGDDFMFPENSPHYRPGLFRKCKYHEWVGYACRTGPGALDWPRDIEDIPGHVKLIPMPELAHVVVDFQSRVIGQVY